MKSIKALILGISLSISISTLAQEQSQQKLPLLSIVTEMPDTAMDSLSEAFSKKAIPSWAAIISTTALTYHYDEDLIEGSQNTGRRWGLAQHDHTKTVLKMGQYDILRLPSDTASWLYFMGDGWLDMMVAGGFMATGYFGDHVRPYNTAIQLIHGMVVSGIAVQVLKRSTGRESPSDASCERGCWRPFTEPRKYDAHTSKYDAMPSGHVMTTTLVWTIIRTNYSEYDHILFPAEIAWISTLGFAMMNNKVHWASDYPLAIGMGYVIGKAATRMGQPYNKKAEDGKTASNWFFMPGASLDGTSTLNAIKYF